MFFVFDSIPDWHKNQGMCDRVIYEDSFMLIYCSGRYKTQKMCGETVNDCLEALKLIRDWFLASNMPKNFHDALFANDSILIKILVKSIFLLMNWLFSA